jgi:glycosyltransferase involved in cell wall biosynthesis
VDKDEKNLNTSKKQDLIPIKVLHLISTLDVGGAEQNLLRLISTMDTSTFQNHVVCMTKPGIVGQKLEKTSTPVSSLNMKKGVPDIRAVLRLRFLARLLRPDIIQCWMYHANLLGLTIPDRARILWNIRCSDLDLSLYGTVYRFAVMAGARLSSIPYAVAANSIAGRDVHERLGYHPQKWVIIPNGFDTEIFKPDPDARFRIRSELGIPDDALVIGLIGRFDPMKDHSSFFAASLSFLKPYPHTHFILAGRGVTNENPQIRDQLGQRANLKKFHLLGERDDIPRILSAIDIASSSSISEGFPNAIGEAMACGVPCVATDAGDSGLLMGDTGLVVNRKSPQELCKAWDMIARMTPEARLEMGSRARERIQKHYSQDKTTRSYEDLYWQIINNKNKN